MACALPPRRFRPAARASFVILLFLGGALGAAAVEEAPPPRPADGPAPPPVPVLSLWDCRRIALEKQPVMAAAHASLAFARARAAGAEDVMVPTVLRPDLPVRRGQAALGVKVAEAQVCQAEWDTVYSVTRNYISALYARDQYRVAEEALTQLDRFKTLKGLETWHKEHADVYIAIARGRREDAIAGYLRAVAALREAMGVGPDFCFHLADQGLAPLNPPVCREQVIDLAVSRRGEIAQTSVLAQIFALEVEAQGTSHHPLMATFAANGDLHAAPVPPNLRDGAYRPGGLAPEMPTQLAGPKDDRVEQARALHARAEEVVAKTRGLIVLEAEDAYLRWTETSRQLAPFRDALGRADKLASQMEKDVPTGAISATIMDVFNERVLARHNQLDYNTAVYNSLLALASLERITAGGFCAGFETILSPQGLPAPAAPVETAPAAAPAGTNGSP